MLRPKEIQKHRVIQMICRHKYTELYKLYVDTNIQCNTDEN